MKAVIQRVSQAAVHCYDSPGARTASATRRIGQGYVVLLGVAQGDTEADADRLVEKLVVLRVFADAEYKMNLDLRQAGGSLLIVSQFTLLADLRKGRRPSFVRAADPQTAERLYRYVVHQLLERGFVVETGEFGAHMTVEISNDGPVTILLDSEDL